MSSFTIGLLTSLAPVLVQFLLFLRWLQRRMRDDEIVRAFVRDMATNHLPHIYSALRQIMERCPALEDLRNRECPFIRYLDLEETTKERG
ncbi:MAG: hypothetical protein ABSF92_01340 [Candidatus Acidiferrales bacterium]|jgi:hypothetical protein